MYLICNYTVVIVNTGKIKTCIEKVYVEQLQHEAIENHAKMVFVIILNINYY